MFPRPVGPLSGFAVLTTAGEGDTAPGFWQPVPREVRRRDGNGNRPRHHELVRQLLVVR